MKPFFLFGVLVILLAACGGSPTPTPTQPPAPQNSANTDLSAVETAVTQRVLATLTASAPTQAPAEPTLNPTVTPPPLPPTEPPPTAAPPTLSAQVSPSVTPVPELPTQPPRAAPTQAPTEAALVVSRDALVGKILFKSTRGGGGYPNNPIWYVMDADGSNVQKLPGKEAGALYQELRPLEGYSPDRTQLVVGEVACSNPPCSLYIGEPAVAQSRSQGEWTGSKRKPYTKAVDPAWSPNGAIIVFVANWENDRTNNIFRGTPFQKNPDFRRLTDFGGQRDTRNPSFSPDGSQIVFATQDGPRWQLWVLNPNAEDFNTSNAHNLSNSEFQDWDPVWIK